MFIAAEQPLVGYRNGTFVWSFQLTQDGVPLNLTAWTGKVQFREYPGAPGDPFLSLSTEDAPTPNGSSFVLVDASLGSMRLTIAEDDWADPPDGTGFPAPIPIGVATRSAYDIVLTDPGGTATPYVAGVMTLNQGVTR